jgi:hypothetical protein
MIRWGRWVDFAGLSFLRPSGVMPPKASDSTTRGPTCPAEHLPSPSAWLSELNAGGQSCRCRRANSCSSP